MSAKRGQLETVLRYHVKKIRFFPEETCISRSLWRNKHQDVCIFREREILINFKQLAHSDSGGLGGPKSNGVDWQAGDSGKTCIEFKGSLLMGGQSLYH